jgi:small GTP-binding protein
LVGDVDVGKTCYLARLAKNIFNQQFSNTIGVLQETKYEVMENGKMLKATIWDTSGQERYKAITNAHYRECAGVLLFFDLVNKLSFDSVVEWINEIRENSYDVSFKLACEL